jgi:hypothetical protein
VHDADITDGNALSDKVDIDIDMFGALMLNRVGREVDDADVVTVDKSGLRQQGIELLEELS